MDTVHQVVLAVVGWIVLRFCVFPLLWRLQNYISLRHIPTDGPTNWFDGHLSLISEIGTDVRRWTNWMNRGHRRILRCRLLYITEINMIHPETVSVILKTATPKGEMYAWIRTWIGDGLLISTGKKWARDRRLLTNGFHFGILRGYLPVYKQAAGIMLDLWAETKAQDGGRMVDITKCCKLLTLDVILRCIMSFTSNCQLANIDQSNELAQYASAVQEIGRCIFLRVTSPWQYSDILFTLSANGRKFNRLKGFCCAVSQRVIHKRRQEISELMEGSTGTDESEQLGLRAARYLDFLDILLTVKDEEGKGLSDQEIQEQVDTFLFEGHDTTASALQWTLFYLAKYPELQEKCRQEVERTLDERKEVSYEQLGKLPYLTQFIKESMRLSATVPFISRKIPQPVIVDGYTLPAGTSVTVPILALHRNPDVWERPEHFDPERFSPENSADRHPFAFIPFSAGPRNCIGQVLAMDELKSVVAMVLLRFRLRVNPDDEDPILTAELVSRTLKSMRLLIEEI